MGHIKDLVLGQIPAGNVVVRARLSHVKLSSSDMVNSQSKNEEQGKSLQTSTLIFPICKMGIITAKVGNHRGIYKICKKGCQLKVKISVGNGSICCKYNNIGMYIRFV